MPPKQYAEAPVKHLEERATKVRPSHSVADNPHALDDALAKRYGGEWQNTLKS